MPDLTLANILQAIIGLGLLNVWIVRPTRSTSFRGRDAPSLKEEFAAYGLPEWVFYTVGILKIGSAIALLVGLWVPALTLPAAALVVALMLGALAMHGKVHDPLVKALPAALMLAMSVTLSLLALN